MKPPALEMGQLVILGVGANGRREWFRTRVVDAQGEVVWIEAPYRNGQPILPAEGQEIDFHTWRAMDARYTIRAATVSVERKPQALMALRMLDAARVQQREYFRVPLYAEGTGSVKRSDGRVHELQLKVHDISAGGLRARSSISLGVGEEIDVSLNLPGGDKPVGLRAWVVRIVDPPRPPDRSCEFGAAFVNIEPRARELIIQLTLKIQQEWRRRGVL